MSLQQWHYVNCSKFTSDKGYWGSQSENAQKFAYAGYKSTTEITVQVNYYCRSWMHTINTPAQWLVPRKCLSVYVAKTCIVVSTHLKLISNRPTGKILIELALIWVMLYCIWTTTCQLTCAATPHFFVFVMKTFRGELLRASVSFVLKLCH